MISFYTSNLCKKLKHRTDLPLLMLLVPCLILLYGCGSATDPGHNDNGNGTATPGPNEVYMVGQSFSPSTREVTVGTTVTWTNQSNEVHTVTSGSGGSHDGKFDSGSVQPGAVFSFTFDETGSFPYYCIPHPGMTGTIVVVNE